MIAVDAESIFTSGENDNYKAQILKDSIANDVRLTTMLVTFPRPYLAEMNTHRDFSRNSASSRAIPTEKNIENVRNNPYVPETFNQRVKGMGVGDPFAAGAQEDCRQSWLWARDQAVVAAERLNDIGVDKSRANRLLEPFMWHTAIITSTQWSNYFGLRCPPGDEPSIDFPAQPEMQQISILMRNAMRASTPRELADGEWHLPMITEHEFQSIATTRIEAAKESNPDAIMEAVMKSWCMIASRRLARVSFDKHTDTEPISVSIDKAGDLAIGGHFSPFEHVATPITRAMLNDRDYRAKFTTDLDSIWVYCSDDYGFTDIPIGNIRCGNLRGYYQFRKEFAEEADHSMILDYEVL